MVASFDPSIVGIFVFGLIAGICPCNSVICLGLIGYLTSGEHDLSLLNILKLVLAFSFGTILRSVYCFNLFNWINYTSYTNKFSWRIFR